MIPPDTAPDDYLSDDEGKEYLGDAIEQIRGLEFLLGVALKGGPDACVTEEFLEKAAHGSNRAKFALAAKLKRKFGPDFNTTHWLASVKEKASEIASAAPSKLICNENGTPKAILANAFTQVKDSGAILVYDQFFQRTRLDGGQPWGDRKWSDQPWWRDEDDLALTNWLQHGGVVVGKSDAADAARMFAAQSPVHPVREYLQACAAKWDGTLRLHNWMEECLSAPSIPHYTSAISTKWPISGVARIMEPGCKADHVIVIEGGQGVGKSTALRALCNGHISASGGTQWFLDHLPKSNNSADVGLSLQGAWIIEIQELDALRRMEVTAIKEFISRQADKFRSPYGRNVHDYPRQCIFAGSTNDYYWAGDPSGGRRFWPVRVGDKINVPRILEIRDQLWGEAYKLWESGYPWHLTAKEQAAAEVEQGKRYNEHPWTEKVAAWLSSMDVIEGRAYSIEEIGNSSLGLAAVSHKPSDKKTLQHIVERCGWVPTPDGRRWIRG